MKRSSKELKQLAREALIGNYGNFAIIVLVYFIIAFGIEMIPAFFADNTSISGLIVREIVSIILSLIVSILAAGIQKTALNIIRKEPVKVSDLFYAFTHHPDKYIVVSFLMVLIALAAQIPTIILAVVSSPGIYAFSQAEVIGMLIATVSVMLVMLLVTVIILLRYTLAMTLLLENPELGAIESMRMSAQLMKDNKGRYFYLMLSFLGMQLLALCTCGIAYFWVVPYTTTTCMQFYLEVTGELDNTPRDTGYMGYQDPDYWY